MEGHSLIVDHNGRPISAAATGFEASATGGDYDAASISRRLGTWGLSGNGPNASLAGPLHALRSRCRHTIRTNPVASGAVDSFVANMVGTDISPRWELDDEALKEDIQQLWYWSQEEMDYAGVYDFYGQIEQVAMAQFDAGEALAQFKTRPMSAGLQVPLQVQLLEADHLDAAYNSVAPNGNQIRHSIEWNKRGQRVAYWLFREHPGELYMFSGQAAGQRVRVPAGDILHVFRPKRINQARGCPWLASTLIKLHEIDQTADAVLVRQKIANLFAVFFKKTTGAPSGTIGGQPRAGALPGSIPTTTDQTTGRKVPVLEPGLSCRLRDNEDVVFTDPPDVGDNYKDFITQQFREVARGLGITYEQLTGDLEGVTFSSIRSGLIEFRRLCEMLQARILIHQYCRPVTRRWVDAAVLSRAIKIADYTENRRRYWKVAWHPQGWDFVDPVKDRIAEQMDIRNGLDSRTSRVAKRGRDVEVVDREIVADNARADRHGLILDSDPRHTAKSGVLQAAEDKAIKETLNDA